ncbi:MAG TPA: hypothetical protein PKE65_00585 [Rhizobiaceae bacterium]|nr:hypothetical protein [Rhizobiaceae bacterium]
MIARNLKLCILLAFLQPLAAAQAEQCRLNEGPEAASFIVGGEADRPFPPHFVLSAGDSWTLADVVWREVTARDPDGPLGPDDAVWAPAAMLSCGSDLLENPGNTDFICQAGQFFDGVAPVFPSPDEAAKGSVSGGDDVVVIETRMRGPALWVKFTVPEQPVGWIASTRLECDAEAQPAQDGDGGTEAGSSAPQQ